MLIICSLMGSLVVESQVFIYRVSVTIGIRDEDLPDVIPCGPQVRCQVHVGPRGPLLAMDNTQSIICWVLEPCVF